MINVERLDANSLANAVEFLTSVPSIEKIDEKILNNASLAYDDGKIVGCISFEEFSNVGLIRYFVFKKLLSHEYLASLLNNLEQSAKDKGLKSLVCIAECSQIEELFRSLDFTDIPKKKIFINEENVENTGFKSALFLSKNLILQDL